MTIQRFTNWDQRSALGGAAVWAVLAGMAGAGRAPLGVIELLFLFAPLVIVPLGLALARKVSPLCYSDFESSLLRLHPFAAGLTLMSFWLSPGSLAGLLALPWLLFCGTEALAGGLTLLQEKHRTLITWAVNTGRIDLAIAGGWLVASRLGMRPMGVQEPIGLLTAVHFHYTGFAAAILAGALLTFVKSNGKHARFLNVLIESVLVIPFVVAAGFVWSASLKMAAAVLLSVSLVCLAAAQLWITPRLSNTPARVYVCLSALSVMFAMVLASVYAIGDWLKQDWLLIPQMASTHGVLNGLGFALLGLLGWLIETSNTTPR